METTEGQMSGFFSNYDNQDIDRLRELCNGQIPDGEDGDVLTCDGEDGQPVVYIYHDGKWRET
jgi:hypothetical protein